MSLKRKRTVAEEKRVINSKWELDYFMIETEAHIMMCLRCNQVVKTAKGDNAKQNFFSHGHTLMQNWKASQKRFV